MRLRQVELGATVGVSTRAQNRDLRDLSFLREKKNKFLFLENDKSRKSRAFRWIAPSHFAQIRSALLIIPYSHGPTWSAHSSSHASLMKVTLTNTAHTKEPSERTSCASSAGFLHYQEMLRAYDVWMSLYRHSYATKIVILNLR